MADVPGPNRARQGKKWDSRSWYTADVWVRQRSASKTLCAAVWCSRHPHIKRCIHSSFALWALGVLFGSRAFIFTGSKRSDTLRIVHIATCQRCSQPIYEELGARHREHNVRFIDACRPQGQTKPVKLRRLERCPARTPSSVRSLVPPIMSVIREGDFTCAFELATSCDAASCEARALGSGSCASRKRQSQRQNNARSAG
jgi:hypothetical protein